MFDTDLNILSFRSSLIFSLMQFQITGTPNVGFVKSTTKKLNRHIDPTCLLLLVTVITCI